MGDLVIYHNGVCSKSRGALELLIENGIPHQVRWYLTNPLNKKELKTLLKKLGMKASDLVRKSEELYKEQYLGRAITEQEWLTILKENPVLIERPIVEKDDRAIIARPAERIFELKDK